MTNIPLKRRKVIIPSVNREQWKRTATKKSFHRSYVSACNVLPWTKHTVSDRPIFPETLIPDYSFFSRQAASKGRSKFSWSPGNCHQTDSRVLLRNTEENAHFLPNRRVENDVRRFTFTHLPAANVRTLFYWQQEERRAGGTEERQSKFIEKGKRRGSRDEE